MRNVGTTGGESSTGGWAWGWGCRSSSSGRSSSGVHTRSTAGCGVARVGRAGRLVGSSGGAAGFADIRIRFIRTAQTNSSPSSVTTHAGGSWLSFALAIIISPGTCNPSSVCVPSMLTHDGGQRALIDGGIEALRMAWPPVRVFGSAVRVLPRRR